MLPSTVRRTARAIGMRWNGKRSSLFAWRSEGEGRRKGPRIVLLFMAIGGAMLVFILRARGNGSRTGWILPFI